MENQNYLKNTPQVKNQINRQENPEEENHIDQLLVTK